ncbi:hypothetical protein SAMN04487846_2812 [Microbacterium sp. cf046]|uniref:hypothetical protein n=1 Tax=Microbacterium sp. cf046 TaxID=1761803 RepID=UPI0008ED58D8|nr:hypothetical protein [Microbacterium sp. cf046]SFS13948.1 hypothetical protein SAMN04487846_2812 [Microbacterium sp. cf046]
MTVVMSRREQKAARRADLSGAGPVLEERAPMRFPGATGAFALFGEVLLTGLLIAVGGLLLVTLPAALAAGIRHLRRYLNAEASPQRRFWQDYLKALPGGLVVGALGLVLVLLLVLDIDLAASGALPGGVAVAAVGWLGLAAVAVTLLAAAGAWGPDAGWSGAMRGVPAALRADVTGVLFLVATAAFVCVATWMLVPLVIPALGCVALAVVAIPARRRRR